MAVGGQRRARAKSDFTYYAIPDHILTVLFFGIVGLTCYILPLEELKAVGCYAVGTVFAILASKNTFRWVAPLIGTEKAVSKPRNVRKFADQGWQLMIHACMTLLEVAVLHEDKWRMWTEPDSLWEEKGMSVFNPHRDMKPLIRMLYLSQMGVWAWTAVSHRFFEARHKDYYVMYIHHILTLVLLLGSYVYGFNKIGAMVLFVHDISDIPVDLLKMFNYLGLDASVGAFLVEISFGTHMFVWPTFRGYFFPFKIIAATFSNAAKAHILVPLETTTWEVLTSPFLVPECPPGWVLRLAMLCLLVLHAWWYWLSIKIVIKLVTGENAHDAGREEYEGDSSDSEAEPEAKTKVS